MAEPGTRTFHEDSGRCYGRHVTGFAAIFAAFGVAVMISPLRWHGTSIALSLLVGLAIIAATVPLFRWGRRLSRVALVTSPSGVQIRGPIRDHELTWDQIRAFTPGWVSAVSAFRGEMPVVVAELADGRRLVVQALRVDYGPFKNKEAEAKVHHVCEQIERQRPGARDVTPERGREPQASRV
jgi:Bacterial PH domain